MTKSTYSNKYLFVLGRDTGLSEAEIKMYFKDRSKFRIIDSGPESLLISFEEKISPKKVISELGGTTKICSLIADIGEGLENEVAMKIRKTVTMDRVNFGISCYSSRFDDFMREQIKDAFKKERIKAQQKRAKQGFNFSPTEVSRDNFIEFVKFKKQLFWTEGVTESSEYFMRDEKRPSFDSMKATSIRLSKIMINLSGVLEGEVLLDPFCGNGTIMQEAGIRGIKVVGIDKDLKDASKNLKWVSQNYKIDYKLIEGKSEKVSDLIKGKVDVIVTEPFLGPFFRGNISLNYAQKISSMLRRMYDEFLKSAHSIVKKRIVLIVPRIKTSKKNIGVGFKNILKRHGYIIEDSVENPFLIEGKKIDRLIYIIRPIEKDKYSGR